MLGSLTRRCHRLSQGLWRRGIVTHRQEGSRGVGRRQQPAPAAPPPLPQKDEWWAVDGELFKAEKFDPKVVLAPLENEHIPNRKRRKDRIKHLTLTRLKLRAHGQEPYWAAYMRRYQIMRDHWEKHVWDPKPVPAPKTRNPLLVAKDAEKYVWRDPRRDAYSFDDPRSSRMDRSLPTSRFDNKTASKVQGMDRYPSEGRRDPGGPSYRPGVPFQPYMKRELYKDSMRSPVSHKDQDAYKDDRKFGAQRNRDYGRQNMQTYQDEDFDSVYSGRETNRRQGHEMEHGAQFRRHQRGLLSSEDDEDDLEGVDFNWDEGESEGEDEEDEEDDTDEDEDKPRNAKFQSENLEFQPKKRGWYGHEDDLFKDDD